MLLRVLSNSGAQIARILSNPRNASVIQERSIHRWVRPTLVVLKHRKKYDKFKQNPRNQFLEWNFDAELYAFGKRLNEEFDANLLQRAFTHRSYIIQQEMAQKKVGIDNPELNLQDNSKLIQEGEAFMSDYIELYLKAALPKFPEEGIIAIRDYLMSEKILSDVSFKLGTKDLIFSNEETISEETLSKTFKAVVAVLIHSSGADRAAHFVRDFVITMLNGVDVNELWNIENPMEMLEQILAKSNKTVEPRLIGQLGKNTLLACYRVGLYVNKNMLCYGFGESVDIAKEMAAREGLKLYFGTRENMAPINFKIDGIPKISNERIKITSG